MRVDRDRLLEQSQGLDAPLFRQRKEIRKCAQVEIVSGEVRRRPRGGAAHLGRLQRRFDNAGDVDRNLVLKLEHVFQRPIEAVGPEMRTGLCNEQLPGDTHPAAAFAHAAFEDIAHAQFAADLLYVDRLALVGEARIAGDDKEPADAREGGDDLLDHAIGEIVLLRVARHVLERQYRDRGLIGQRQRRFSPHPISPSRRSSLPRVRGRGREGACRVDPIDPHGAGDVFQRLIAEILERAVDPPLHLLVDDGRHADFARLRNPLQSGGDIHPVAVDVAILDDHIAEIDADAEDDPLMFGRLGIALGHALLHRHGAGDRSHDARELDQQAVASGLDNPAPVLGDFRGDQLATMGPQPGQCAGLVLAHEA